MNNPHDKTLAHLLSAQTVTVRDPLWKDIRLSPALRKIFLTPAVQKLGRIKQLGPAFHHYPGAVHTRLDHSLGVYHLSFSILTSLLQKSLRGEMRLPLTEEGMNTFLCASLLHDIGHFPFAHSLKELPLNSHEQLAARLIEEDTLLNEAILAAGLDPSLVADIIDEDRSPASNEVLFYRNVLSGTLDPDKLDYLNRDAFFCGVPYGTQDVSYITDKLTIVGGMPALEQQAIASVEHLLFSKYLMYRNVYWHRVTRSATAMIKKAVLSTLQDGVLPEQKLYGLDDEQFFLLPQSIDHPCLSLFSAVRDNQLLACSYDQPFDASGELEKRSLGLERRHEVEEILFSRLSHKPQFSHLKPYQVIVDIPEPISFESDIPILSEDGSCLPFKDQETLFSHDIGRVFTKSLRKTRIFTPAYVSQEAVREALEF